MTGNCSNDQVQAAAAHLYDAECALHTAHQSHIDAWIAAAHDKLHEAIVELQKATATTHPRTPVTTRLRSVRGQTVRPRTTESTRSTVR